MRIVPFPSEQPLPGEEQWTAELDAALAGELSDGDAEAWRELREDVRSLALPMSPVLQARLERELARRGALGVAGAGEPVAVASPAGTIAPATVDGGHPRRRTTRAVRDRLLARPAHRRRAAFGAVAATMIAALVVALVISSAHTSPPQALRTPHSVGEASTNAQSAALSFGSEYQSAKGGARASSAATAGPIGAAMAPGRVQQLAASITLGAAPADVQAISDQVSQLAAREGGYVHSSNVHVQQQGTSEATLSLRIPSSRLSAALAAIGQLATVRAENQSLEDITGSYEAAHRQLSDALAERSALLRALAVATTEGQIDSLREHLADANAAIARAQGSVNSVDQRASVSEVEVSVQGTHDAGAEGLTLHRGLHDAGEVLLAALAVALIACAALIPLALLLGATLIAHRAWRRHARERALGA